MPGSRRPLATQRWLGPIFPASGPALDPTFTESSWPPRADTLITWSTGTALAPGPTLVFSTTGSGAGALEEGLPGSADDPSAPGESVWQAARARLARTRVVAPARPRRRRPPCERVRKRLSDMQGLPREDGSDGATSVTADPAKHGSRAACERSRGTRQGGRGSSERAPRGSTRRSTRTARGRPVRPR